MIIKRNAKPLNVKASRRRDAQTVRHAESDCLSLSDPVIT